MTALLTVRAGEGDDVDVAKLESQLNLALSALSEFDQIGRLAVQAQKNLENLREIGGRVHKKLYDALTGGLTILHP